MEQKITEITNRIIEEFTNHPIKTTIKGVVMIWLIKKAVKFINE
jgi:hypothetical protein